jgi:hypothetical protein
MPLDRGSFLIEVSVMNTISESLDLKELGLEGAVLGDEVSIPLSAGESPQGLSKGVAVAAWTNVLAVGFSAVGGLFAEGSWGSGKSFLLKVPAMEALGFKARRSAAEVNVLTVTGPEEEQVLIRTAGPALDLVHDPDDPATTHIRFSPGSKVCLIRPSGSGVILRIEGTDEPRLVINTLQSHQAAIRAPIEQWLRALADSWLVDCVQARALARDSWSQIVAAGLVACRLDPANLRETNKLAESIFRGSPDERLFAPLRWMMSLTPTQLEEVEGLGFAETARLEAWLQDLDEHLDVEDVSWRRSLVRFCIARDEAECVTTLLRGVGRSERIIAALNLLDREAGPFVESLPTRIATDEEVLRRAWLCCPDAWWTSIYEHRV